MVNETPRPDSSVLSLLSPEEKKRLDVIFQQALKNTDKQLFMKEDGTAYVQTGDIPAEWLRDSSAQVRLYLFFAKEDKETANKLKAVIERQALYMAIDPYANAFRDDFTIWERKFELDSLSYPILLAWTYWKVTGDDSVFTPAVKKAFDRAVETMIAEQHHDNATSTYAHHELVKNPVAHTGMIWSAFRPSDDACKYHYLIPSQMQAVQALTALEEMETFMGRPDKTARAQKLKKEVQAGIEKYGTVDHPKHGRIYAYEVDGRGNANLMDDANLPSLLSVPYFGYAGEEDAVYKATRRFVLSKDNPYFYSGRFKGQDIYGVGSPHTPLWASFRKPLRVIFSKIAHPFKRMGMVWPLAQLAQGLTTKNKDEQAKVLKMIVASDPGDRRLHESYLPGNPKVYTRPDFGWPNALLAEFMLTTVYGRPALPVPPPPAPLPASLAAQKKKAPPKKGL
jgi:meiotically up-regulated gene 157 (Mug157) protein